MQVHTRSEHNITAILQGFITDSLTHLAHQVGIPGRSQTGSNRETSSKVATAVTVAMGIDMNTGRTITLYGSRNTKTRNGHGSTGSTRHELLLMSEHSTATHESIVTTTHQHLGFLFQGHRLDHFIDVVGIQLRCRLSHQGCRHGSCCYG
ncbi:unknown [Prevotella sp. CAG:732]|nr:unknown [Prevotella sp. CAG:732]